LPFPVLSAAKIPAATWALRETPPVVPAANFKNMNQNKEHATHARALQADIIAAPDVWLPRREALLGWLETFLQRVAAPNYDLGETEAADLVAMDEFLRTKLVPVAA
jgi:hypothetical protein